MAKNITLDIVDRLDKIEKEQRRLAEERQAELAAEGTIVTVEELIKPSVTARSVREKPSGVLNGVNKVFVLKNTPLADTEEVFYCGILLAPGLDKDYTISGKNIVLNYAPASDEDIKVSYEYTMV